MYHPFIQGPSQETIQQIIMETNTKINIPPPSVQKDEITISGEKEGVAKAKETIWRIYKEKVLLFMQLYTKILFIKLRLP